MAFTFYEALAIFFIYGFLGWCTEVVYAAVNTGKFVNRGFLIGPMCPIYGMGVLAVLYLLNPAKDNIILLYLGSVVITSAIELLLGFISKKLLHERLWDYSGEHFNLGGYICLKFSLLWGIGCICIVNGVHPLIEKLIKITPNVLGIILLTVSSALFVTDLFITGINALKIDKKMKSIDSVAEKLEKLSDSIGEELYEGVERVREKTRDGEAIREKYEELYKKYTELAGKNNLVHNHLFNAFPHLKQGRYKKSFERLQKFKPKKLSELKKEFKNRNQK